MLWLDFCSWTNCFRRSIFYFDITALWFLFWVCFIKNTSDHRLHLFMLSPPSLRGPAQLLIKSLDAAYVNQALILCRLQIDWKAQHKLCCVFFCKVNMYGYIRSVPSTRISLLACWWAQLGLCLAIQSVASMHKSARGMIWTESLQQIITDLQFNGFWGLSQPHTGSQWDRAY